MTTYRLRSQLFVAALSIILGLAVSLLLFIRHAVNVEVQKQIRTGTDISVRAFETVQRQRELQLSQTAAMLAEQPTLKALMSTEHAHDPGRFGNFLETGRKRSLRTLQT